MTDKTSIWDVLAKTDPSQTKQFKRAGGFSGTAMKPIWIVKRLTEQFGPCGEGWGVEKPNFQIVPGHNGEMLVYCTVAGWHGKPDNYVYGVGGDKVTTYIKANDQYKRPERWENDDEAFKKAYTDAVGNAFKFIGVGADIHMGQFDDNKYVQRMEREFAEPQPASTPKSKSKPEPLKGIMRTRAEARIKFGEIVKELNACGDTDMLEGYLSTIPLELEQFETELPSAWSGDGSDFIGLKAEIDNARKRCAEENK